MGRGKSGDIDWEVVNTEVVVLETMWTLGRNELEKQKAKSGVLGNI